MSGRSAARWLIPALLLGLLAAQAVQYLPFLSDDALISLRYARRLIRGQGLTWTEGPPVEGYSNLLWLLLVAGLGWLGVDLILGARILGGLGMAAVIGLLAARFLTDRERPGALPGFAIGGLFFAGSAPAAVWAIGGLEQPLVAAALAAAVPLYWRAADGGFADRKAALAPSLALGALCLTRPDGPLFTAAFAGAAALAGGPGRTGRRRALAFAVALASLPALFTGGQLLFRLAYYGEWLPNTALVKLAPSPSHLRDGLLYVGQGILALSPASLAALLLLVLGVAWPASRRRFVPLALAIGIWLAYLAAIGGDIFPAYRHFVPVIVLLSYALAEGTAALWEVLAGRAAAQRALAAGLLACAAVGIPLQSADKRVEHARQENWEWQGRSLGLTLGQAFAARQPLMAVTAAGCLPYWSDLPCLDMLGLNDHHLPRHKPAGSGAGFLGHELSDADYVMARAPDIIVFHVGDEPRFRCGLELSAHPEFRRQYTMVRLRTAVPPQSTALAWFRTASGKIGVRRSGERLIVPAYFLNAFPDTTAYLEGGRLVVGVAAGQPAGVDIEGITGDWRVEVEGAGAAAIEARVERTDRGARVVLATESRSWLPVESIVLSP